MPELPEVESLASFLARTAVGKVVDRVGVASLSALKTYDPPIEALRGLMLRGTGRRGKHLLLHFDDLVLVVHLARAGWLRWKDEVPSTPVRPSGRSPLALRVRFDDGSGFEITEAGTEKRVALWLARDPDHIEAVAALGIDPLDAAFTPERLAAILTDAGGAQLKHVLTDQRRLAGVGNAYSDDALHLARMSPFKQANKLAGDDITRLHGALVAVLRDAVERSRDLPAAGLKSEKRSGMRVHGRSGEPCPECGDTVRDVSFATKSLQYCPTCQTGGRPLADRRLSRLLK